MLELRNGPWLICLKCLGQTLSVLPTSGFLPGPIVCTQSLRLASALGSDLYSSLLVFWDSSTALTPDSLTEELIPCQLLRWVGSCSQHKSLLFELLFKSGGSLLFLGLLPKIKCKSSSFWSSHCAATLTVHYCSFDCALLLPVGVPYSQTGPWILALPWIWTWVFWIPWDKVTGTIGHLPLELALLLA